MVKTIAYKFSTGWLRGIIKGLVTRKTDPDCGKFTVKFTGFADRDCLTLHMDDYDSDDIWVLLKSIRVHFSFGAKLLLLNPGKGDADCARSDVV